MSLVGIVFENIKSLIGITYRDHPYQMRRPSATIFMHIHLGVEGDEYKYRDEDESIHSIYYRKNIAATDSLRAQFADIIYLYEGGMTLKIDCNEQMKHLKSIHNNNQWKVKEGDLVVKKGKHEAKVHFVEGLDTDSNGEISSILLVNGRADMFFDSDSIDNFFNEYRLLVKKENMEEEIWKLK